MNLESDDEVDELKFPGIFDLRPLFTQEITLRIREIRVAQFHYVPDMDDLDESDDSDEGDSCRAP